MPAELKHIKTSVLDIAYEESGPAGGPPVFLMHGFPYDPRGYDGVVPLLTAQGCRTIVPYICGYDWGGRACCIVAALWPERVQGLVTGGGYNVHDVAGSVKPTDAAQEHRAWYQYYFCTPRGVAGLAENRRDIAKLLWQLWLVGEPFDAALFEKSAPSFDNPDFVDVVIHSYRVRYGYVTGDTSLAGIEKRLAAKPPITVPTIVLHGEADGIALPPSSEGHARHFTGPYRRRLVPRAGHALPQDATQAVADAVLELVRTSSA
jgi:pimeloyl-ACP methyl ester carboxylesterase